MEIHPSPQLDRLAARSRIGQGLSTRVLVTGATGFVGSHVAEACVARGIAGEAVIGRVESVKQSVVSVFVFERRFFTRDEAASSVGREPIH